MNNNKNVKNLKYVLTSVGDKVFFKDCIDIDKNTHIFILLILFNFPT